MSNDSITLSPEHDIVACNIAVNPFIPVTKANTLTPTIQPKTKTIYFAKGAKAPININISSHHDLIEKMLQAQIQGEVSCRLSLTHTGHWCFSDVVVLGDKSTFTVENNRMKWVFGEAPENMPEGGNSISNLSGTSNCSVTLSPNSQPGIIKILGDNISCTIE